MDSCDIRKKLNRETYMNTYKINFNPRTEMISKMISSFHAFTVGPIHGQAICMVCQLAAQLYMFFVLTN